MPGPATIDIRAYIRDIPDFPKPGILFKDIDDGLATGGTMRACRDLVQSTGAEVVACAFLIELSFLGGRAKLEPGDVFSLITY
jgi:adenine phosphoribosyltransferase